MATERPQPRKESRELLGERGRVPVASARHLAGVEEGRFTLPGTELTQHREKHAQRLREVTPEMLDHSHVRTASTQERLRQNSVSPEEIALKNRAWGEQMKEWLEAAPQAVQDKIGQVYYLHAADENILGRIEQFRSYYFDTDRPAGEVNERAVIDDLVYRHNNEGDITQRNSVGVEQLAEDLAILQPFLHLFGGEKTVTHITHAALAEAALAEAPEVGHPDREQFVEEMLNLVEQDMPEDDVKHYSDMPSDTVIALASPEGELTAPPSPAPINEEIGGQEDEDGVGSGDERRSEAEESTEQGDRSFTFTEFYQEALDRQLENFPELREWLEARMTALPEMRVGVGEAPVTNGKDWNADYVRNDTGEVTGVQEITNTRRFFSVQGVEIQKGQATWPQPGLIEGTFPLELSTAQGVLRADVSGIVAIVKDSTGSILLAVDQEPLANTPNHVVVKTPLQTSAGKFMEMQGGDLTKDANFSGLIQLIYGTDHPFDDFLTDLKTREGAVIPLPTVNGNRIESTNIGVEIVVDDSAKAALEADGKYRWVSRDERKALERAGILNGIASSTISAFE